MVNPKKIKLLSYYAVCFKLSTKKKSTENFIEKESIVRLFSLNYAMSHWLGVGSCKRGWPKKYNKCSI